MTTTTTTTNATGATLPATYLSTKYAIQDNTGGWMVASDALPNTHYTPEIEDAQLFDTEAEASARMAEFYGTDHSIIEVAVP